MLAEARNAITHLFQRLPKMRGQVLDWGNKDEDIWEMLKYIAVRMGDLGVMAQVRVVHGGVCWMSEGVKWVTALASET